MSRVFDGDLANYLDLPINFLVNRDISVFLYFKQDTLLDGAMFSMADTASTTVPRIFIDNLANNARFYNQLRTPAKTGELGPITASVWHTAAFSFTANDWTTRGYFNNVRVDIEALDTAPPAAAVNTLQVGRIGDSTPAGPLTGKVAQVIVWEDYALTDADVNTLHNATTTAQLNAVQNANQFCHYPLEGADLTDLNAGQAALTVNGTVASDADDPLAAGPTKTASVRLADLDGNDRANVVTVPWAWYDGLPIAGLGPTDTGTDATDGTGNMTVDIPNSTLTAGQVGYLLIDTGAWQSIHAVTVTES